MTDIRNRLGATAARAFLWIRSWYKHPAFDHRKGETFLGRGCNQEMNKVVAFYSFITLEPRFVTGSAPFPFPGWNPTDWHRFLRGTTKMEPALLRSRTRTEP